jgi:hypothetical protein
MALDGVLFWFPSMRDLGASRVTTLLLMDENSALIVPVTHGMEPLWLVCPRNGY